MRVFISIIITLFIALSSKTFADTGGETNQPCSIDSKSTVCKETPQETNQKNVNYYVEASIDHQNQSPLKNQMTSIDVPLSNVQKRSY